MVVKVAVNTYKLINSKEFTQVWNFNINPYHCPFTLQSKADVIWYFLLELGHQITKHPVNFRAILLQVEALTLQNYSSSYLWRSCECSENKNMQHNQQNGVINKWLRWKIIMDDAIVAPIHRVPRYLLAENVDGFEFFHLTYNQPTTKVKII